MSFRSVSYTHLDVYKRQVLTLLILYKTYLYVHKLLYLCNFFSFSFPNVQSNCVSSQTFSVFSNITNIYVIGKMD